MKRGQAVENRGARELRPPVAGVVTGEQGATPGFVPGTFGEHNELGLRLFLTQGGQHRCVAGHPANEQHPALRALPFLQQRDDFVGHAVVQRAQDVRGRSFVAVEFVGDVRFAVDGTTGRQRHDRAGERTADRFVEFQTHPADLLDEELAAAGGAFVVREHMGDPALREDVNQKGLPAEGDHGVESTRRVPQPPLDGGDFGKVPEVAGNAEGLGLDESGSGEQLIEHCDGTALMGDDRGVPGVAAQGDDLHGQSPDVDTHKRHGSSLPILACGRKGEVIVLAWAGCFLAPRCPRRVPLARRRPSDCRSLLAGVFSGWIACRQALTPSAGRLDRSRAKSWRVTLGRLRRGLRPRRATAAACQREATF